MKRLLMLVVVAMLSFGIASVSFAQEEGTGTAPAEQGMKAPKKHKKKHSKKHHKHSKKKAETPAEDMK